ncbi:MAG: PIN domain-containing protein [Acidimicrobiales bacterium]
MVGDDHRGAQLRALMRRTFTRGGEVRWAAVTLAEVCRGVARTRRVESVIARRDAGQRIRVVPTDERLAKRVGNILHATRSGSDRLADAHVVALCADADVAVVITGDPSDITDLASAIPGTRVVTRRPSLR